MSISPMMRQYLETKEKYKDCILFYRLGDFYEMFFDDAIVVSKVLDLVLTGRDCGLSERAPMCGIPCHAAETYIAKLLENNFKVAVCEQLSDPDESKGLVLRDVVKVITPGTVMEESLLKEDKNNFIASVYLEGGKIGIAWADISTGDFNLTEVEADPKFNNLSDILLSIMPSEVICNQNMQVAAKDLKVIKYDLLPKFDCYYDWSYIFETANSALKKQLGVKSLAAFECENKKHAVSAAGALVEYFKETQKRSLSHLNRISYVKKNRFMTLDGNAIRNLELIKTIRDGKKYGSLLWLLDNTQTGMGARRLYSYITQPLNDEKEINSRLDAVEELVLNVEIREGLKEKFSAVRDIERLAAKASYGSLNPKDCIFLRNTFRILPEIKFLLNSSSSPALKNIENQIICFDSLYKLLDRSLNDNPSALLKDGGFIKKGYSVELDDLKEASIGGKKWLAELEASEREKTGIKNLKIGFNKVFGYYIEVSKSYLDLVPINYIRKQTIAGGERFITPELKSMEDKILGADEESIRLEIKLFGDIVAEISKYIADIQNTAKALANLDVLLSFSIAAIKYNYCKPVIKNDGIIKIEEGRHPVVEAVSKSEDFIPNDTFLDNGENRTMIITGPNMAGKSTYMRQTALIVLMAHMGCFVPAKSASICIVDRIYTRVGASDNLAFDQSTFMVEMTEVANILHTATDKSLLILDEVGRGTSTFDGLSIAWAVMEYISKKLKAKTLFATHFHELTELEGNIEGVKNYKILVKELNDGIVFLRKIARGGANKSFGIDVAALAGIPKQITERAKKILSQLEEADINNSKNKSAQVTISFDNNNEQNKYDEIINSIAKTDIDTLSPIEALNILSDLRKKIINLKK
jgi:DNA mismatch repair protein MutS